MCVDDRALDLDRIVLLGRGPKSARWSAEIVDAADEGALAVDHDDLAVHAAEHVQCAGRGCGGPGSKTAQRTPASVSASMNSGGRSGEPQPSTSDVHLRRRAAPPRAAPPAAAWPTLSSNRMKVSSSTSRARRGDGLEHARVELLAVLEQPDPVAVRPSAVLTGSISAASGAWSDRCDQGRRGSTSGAWTRGVAHVDAVELQQRAARREGARRAAVGLHEDLRQPGVVARGCRARGGASR